MYFFKTKYVLEKRYLLIYNVTMKKEVITKKKDNSLLSLLDSIIDKAKGSIFLFGCLYLVLVFVEFVILVTSYSYIVTNVLPGNGYELYFMFYLFNCLF